MSTLREGNRTFLLIVAGMLFAAYAAPLYFPPAPHPAVSPGPDTPLLARLFPGVPAWWVVFRLVSLLAASSIAALALGSTAPWSPPTRAKLVPPLPRIASVAAVAVALAHAASSIFVESLDRLGQSLYFACFFVPSLVLLSAERMLARSRSTGSRGARLPALAVVAVLGVWFVSRLPDLVDPVRAADPVDTWLSHEWLERAAHDGRNLLTQGFLPGLTCIYMFLQGISFLGPGGIAPTFGWVQGVHVFWCLVAGAGVGAISGILLGPWSAPVAAAAFLFSSFVLLQPLVPAPYVFGPLFTTALALLVIAILTRRSSAALAALGAVSGIAATSHPPLVPIAALALIVGGISALRAPRLPWSAGLIALLALVAAAVPAIPDLETIRSMRDDFTQARGQWSGLEAVLLGQRDPFAVPALWQAGHPGWLDIGLGSLLAPFAIPRTSLRAFGDALFDPISAGLAALGILLAVRRAKHDALPRLLLLALAIGIAPAFASSYDRPSHTRMFVAQVPLAVLAAAGFEVLRQRVFPRVRPGLAAIATAFVIAGAGITLFDVVNPRILASSSVGLTARAVSGSGPAQRTTLLVFPGPADLSWLHEERIVRAVAPASLSVLPFIGPKALESRRSPSLPTSDVFLFSPGLEARLRVAREICARWPTTTIFELRDRAGLSLAFAARPLDTGWNPALPPRQWRARSCSASLAAPSTRSE